MAARSFALPAASLLAMMRSMLRTLSGIPSTSISGDTTTAQQAHEYRAGELAQISLVDYT